MEKLIERKLEFIALGVNPKVTAITRPGEFPPCFEANEDLGLSAKQVYHLWLDAAAEDVGSPPPARKDWPKEPNYCRDCSREHRNRMRVEGRCLFPDTVFVQVGEGDDAEIVGVEK